MLSAAERRELLKAEFHECRSCTRCPQLASTRTSVVFGAGNADADLMFVGEAPGANEDKQGLPFVGQAGKLLDQLLAEIGLARHEVWICNVLKCRPPNNRDPHPAEIEACQGWLMRQIELIEPKVICTLGNFATKLLRDDPTGITRVHGKAEVRIVGRRAVRLMPIYHPAAALYTRSLLDTLRADFARIPGLLAQPHPEQPVLDEPPVPAADGVLGEDGTPPADPSPEPSEAGVPAPEPAFGRDGADEPPEASQPEQIALF